MTIFALAAATAYAQDDAAGGVSAAADPLTIKLSPILKPAFKRDANGQYDVPQTAAADYGGALQQAVADWAGVKKDAVTVAPGAPVVAAKPGSKVVEGGVTCAGPNVRGREREREGGRGGGACAS